MMLLHGLIFLCSLKARGEDIYCTGAYRAGISPYICSPAEFLSYICPTIRVHPHICPVAVYPPIYVTYQSVSLHLSPKIVSLETQNTSYSL